MDTQTSPPILNYDEQGGASYKTDFWQGKGRDYEDRVERIALGRLLHPAQGQRLIEFGAGFGRLSNFFAGYQEVILVDYAKTQLQDARARLGDSKYRYVAANIYQLPFADGIADGATLIRVLHHFVDAPAALAQIRQTLSTGAVFILEYANKRNLKAMLRYALKQQTWSPYTEDPVEFYKLHFDFHPSYIQKTMQNLGFQTQQRLPVSFFRLGILKRTVPTSVLTSLDSTLQNSGLLITPSIFTRNWIAGARPAQLPSAIFKCPACHSTALHEQPEKITCQACGKAWSTADGIYDFREPL